MSSTSSLDCVSASDHSYVLYTIYMRNEWEGNAVALSALWHPRHPATPGP